MKHIYLTTITIISIFALLSCSSDSTTYYTLSVIPTPAEGGTGTPSSGEFTKGEEVEISAHANENWIFDKWEGDYKGSNPITTITMDSSIVIAALFTKQDYPLTIHIEGGGQVLQEIVRSKSTDYPHGTTIRLTAEPDHGWYFSRWEGDDKGSNPITTITMDSSIVIAALFTKQDYPVTIHLEGEGQVYQEIVRSKSTDYPHGTTIRLTAEPDHGWYFSRWEGDVEGEENPVEITVDGETEITAVFERLEVPLTVHVKGEGTVNQQIVPAEATD